uniref:Uncharacterized protein n=1 Tax=Rhizophora mucronata TaxID=61149 RepID=A0A2P2J2H5_RHIMU
MRKWFGIFARLSKFVIFSLSFSRSKSFTCVPTQAKLP